jgi:hypothetical protein
VADDPVVDGAVEVAEPAGELTDAESGTLKAERGEAAEPVNDSETAADAAGEEE